MKQTQIEKDESKVTISAMKAPIFIRIVLTVVLSILILIPLAVTYFVMTFGDGPHINIALSFIFCWGIGFYMLRIILWNSVGREILTLDSEKISYSADYRLFKDGGQEITTNGLETEIIYEDDSNKPVGRLRLRNDTSFVETVLQTSITELEELKNEIKARYNS